MFIILFFNLKIWRLIMLSMERKERKGSSKILLSILVASILMMPLLMDIGTKANVNNEDESEFLTKLDAGWIKYYEGDSWASSVIQTSDDCYVVAGGVGYYPDSNAYLLKTDANGDKLWEKTYGNESGWDAFWGGLIETSDGGYVASGTNDSRSYLVKVDSDGNTLWERLYGEPTNGSILDVQETSDMGFILTGRVYHEPRRGWLIKTDSEGYVLWNKTLGGEYPVTLWTIRISDVGGYVMAGFEADPDKLFESSYAIKTDTSGNIEWEHSYESCQGFKHGVVQTSDDGYIFSGGITIVNSLNVRQISLVKTDLDGNELWSKNFGIPFFSESSFNIEGTTDGGCVVIGYFRGIGTLINYIQSGNFLPLWSKMWLLKFDSDGNLTWDKQVETGVGRSVKQTDEGGYILAGQRGPNNNPKGILLIKTDENGEI
jgi:hypothetical protein